MPRVSLKSGKLTVAMADIKACSRERAGRIRETMTGCPRVISILPARDNPLRLVCLYALPDDKFWWVEALAVKPEIIKAESVSVTFFENVHPDAVDLPEGDPSREVTPCGENCRTCPQYRSLCEGCPSSVFFQD